MLLTKQDYKEAIRVLKENRIVDRDNKMISAYSGKFASIGPDTAMGLLQAVALYESKPGDKPEDSGQQNVTLCKTILRLMPDNKKSDNTHYTLLYEYLQDKYSEEPEKTQFYFDKALVSLKMAIRLFEEK